MMPQPGARLALGFGDLARGHFDRDVGAARLASRVAVERGEVEPLVRFNKVDRKTVAAGRVLTPSSNSASMLPASASLIRLRSRNSALLPLIAMVVSPVLSRG